MCIYIISLYTAFTIVLYIHLSSNATPLFHFQGSERRIVNFDAFYETPLGGFSNTPLKTSIIADVGLAPNLSRSASDGVLKSTVSLGLATLPTTPRTAKVVSTAAGRVTPHTLLTGTDSNVSKGDIIVAQNISPGDVSTTPSILFSK